MSVTDLRRSNRLARRRYAGSGGTWLWIGCASGHGGGLLVKGWERRKSAKQMRTFGTTARELRDKFYRLKARRGYKRAAVAIAHKILVAIYHMLCQQVSYNDLGDLYLITSTKNISRATSSIAWSAWVCRDTYPSTRSSITMLIANFHDRGSRTSVPPWRFPLSPGRSIGE